MTYTSGDPKFTVSDSGEILFTGPGTLEKSASLEFNVTAQDGGDPMNSANALVVINEHRSMKSIENELTTQINSNDTGGEKVINNFELTIRKLTFFLLMGLL